MMTHMARPSRNGACPGGWRSFAATTGYTANHVCDILNWGRGKVGRFEANQWKRPEMSDIRDLIRIYEVEGEERDEIEDLAVRCRVRPWWREYGEIFDNEFPGYENDAATIQVYMPLVVPGLLQTPGLHGGPVQDGRAPARLAPQGRQGAAAQAGDPRPRRRHGAAAVRGDHRGLAALPVGDAQRPAGADRAPGRDEQAAQHRAAHPALRRRPADRHLSMVNIFGFPDDEPPIVFVETDYAVEEVSEAEAVSGYIQSFERACDAALEPEDTTVYLEKLAKRME